MSGGSRRPCSAALRRSAQNTATSRSWATLRLWLRMARCCICFPPLGHSTWPHGRSEGALVRLSGVESWRRTATAGTAREVSRESLAVVAAVPVVAGATHVAGPWLLSPCATRGSPPTGPPTTEPVHVRGHHGLVTGRTRPALLMVSNRTRPTWRPRGRPRLARRGGPPPRPTAAGADAELVDHDRAEGFHFTDVLGTHRAWWTAPECDTGCGSGAAPVPARPVRFTSYRAWSARATSIAASSPG